ncbi:MAG: four helix bundle protein, partial [Polyangiaceae bacterium]
MARIREHDRDLGEQLRRALSSVVLNLSEGSGSRGGHRLARYSTALGSNEESRAALRSPIRRRSRIEQFGDRPDCDCAGWPRGFLLGAPTDPDLQNYRIRLLKLQVRSDRRFGAGVAAG